MENVYRMMFLGRFNKIISSVKITFSKLNNTVQTKIFFKSSKVGLLLFEKVHLLTVGKGDNSNLGFKSHPNNEKLYILKCKGSSYSFSLSKLTTGREYHCTLKTSI